MICGHCGEEYTPLVDAHDCFPEPVGPPPISVEEEPPDAVGSTLRQLAHEGSKDWDPKKSFWDPMTIASLPMEEYKAAREQLLPAMLRSMRYQMSLPRQSGKTNALRYINTSFAS